MPTLEGRKDLFIELAATHLQQCDVVGCQRRIRSGAGAPDQRQRQQDSFWRHYILFEFDPAHRDGKHIIQNGQKIGIACRDVLDGTSQ
jgi:hypothetical protein